MIAFLCVALASAAGAPVRYLVDREIQGRSDRVFPIGTMAVNVSGSFLLGVLIAAHHHGVADLAVTAIGTGLLGSFTTFSTFTWETLRMLEEGSFWEAGVNVVGSIIAGLVAAALGVGLVGVL